MTNQYNLALSGGGLRASYFHLGTVLGFLDLGLFDRISTISSVSGGSIFLSFFCKNLSRNKNKSIFENLEDTERDLITYSSIGPRSSLLPRKGITYTKTQIEALKRILGEVTTIDEIQESVKFELVFCTTSYGNLNGEPKIATFSSREKPGQTNLAEVVAASAALPFVFSPIKIEVNGIVEYYVDGGVLDNLGIDSIKSKEGILIASDASAPACLKGSDGELRIRPAIVANDVALDAIRSKQLAEFVSDEEKNFIHISLRNGEKHGIEPEFSEALSSIRTDLDEFSQSERFSLIAAGYFITKSALEKNNKIPERNTQTTTTKDNHKNGSSLFRDNISRCLEIITSKKPEKEPTKPIVKFSAITAIFIILLLLPDLAQNANKLLDKNIQTKVSLLISPESPLNSFTYPIVVFATWIWQCFILSQSAYNKEEFEKLARRNLLLNLKKGANRFLKNAYSDSVEDKAKLLVNTITIISASIVISVVTTSLLINVFKYADAVSIVIGLPLSFYILLRFFGRLTFNNADLVSTLSQQRSITLLLGGVISDLATRSIANKKSINLKNHDQN